MMADRPLLIFAEPAMAERAKRSGGGSSFRMPSAQEQTERLSPQFRHLNDALERKKIALQGNSLGIEPEHTLVIETYGAVEDFLEVVEKISGLEWLGDVELGPLSPEYGFEDSKDPGKELDGWLCLVMTDELAQRELLSFFNRWQRNPSLRFPLGFAKLKEVFSHLRNIRPWGYEDRIRETGVLEDWQYRVAQGQEIIPFEGELWFRRESGRRRQVEEYVRSIVEVSGGQVLRSCVISEIGYHGLLGMLPVGRVREVVDNPDIRQSVGLLQCDGIRFIRPVGQCAVRVPEDDGDTDTVHEGTGLDVPYGEPIVALLDGLPLAGHNLLRGRLVIDDPEEYGILYPVNRRIHGTAMASLICHGDLGGSGESAKRRVYCRPVMKPDQAVLDKSVEMIPEDVLPVDLIHRSVVRLFDGEGGEPPVAPSVRVINLSIGDSSRLFDREVGPWARLLDCLAYRYGVLFIVSAGNHGEAVVLDVERDAFSGLDAEQREDAVIKAVAGGTRNRRLLAPAETVNGLTVGAVHQDFSRAVLGRRVDPFVQSGLPSVISSHGPGYGRSIKPDLLLPGGRQLLVERLGSSHQKATLEVSEGYGVPGQEVALPGLQGELNRIGYSRGTSNAAALASHSAMHLYEVIEGLRVADNGSLPVEYDAVLLKALLVHGSSWGNSLSVYQTSLRNDRNRKAFKEYVGRFLGYGQADVGRVLTCTDQRVTVVGVGMVGNGEGAEFSFPLPPSLAGETVRRRLTVTLAWLTPLNFKSQKYRVAHLWFDPKPGERLGVKRLESDGRVVQRGTVQHEILEGQRAAPYQDGTNIVIKVSCRAHADTIFEPVRYALAVTLEVGDGTDVPIYEEVRTRLAQPVPVRVATASP